MYPNLLWARRPVPSNDDDLPLSVVEKNGLQMCDEEALLVMRKTTELHEDLIPEDEYEQQKYSQYCN